MVTRLLDPSAGSIYFAGHDIGAVPARRFARRPERARLQLVFQDPGDSLNPSFTAFNAIADPLRRLGNLPNRRSLGPRVEELAELVGLPREQLTRYPHQLSGGQKARVGIARAIALHPDLLVLDEPTSALDVSVQAVILRLLDTLRHQLGMSYLFVSHDLHVVRLLCDRVLVMHRGSLVEEGDTEALFSHPEHSYTRALLAAIPRLE
jgi:peptide/nickel transport system ATP-binding protein